MSVKIMGQVWDLDLPANKLLVLLALTDHADHNGQNIYPSMGLVAWKTGYSERQVRRIVQSLVKDKILSAEKRPGDTTKFTVHIENGKQKEPFKRSSTVGQNVTPDIAMSAQVGHNDVRPTPDTMMSDEPSVKPSVTESSLPVAKSDLDAQFDAIAKVWNNSAGGWVSNIQGMMFGSKKVRGAWKSCQFNPPATIEEVHEFGAYCKKRASDKKPPTIPETIQRWFYDMRLQRKPATKIIPLAPLTDADYPDTADYVNLAGVSNVG